MAAPSYPTVNGHLYDWSSVDISLAGDVTPALKDISYDDELKPGEAKGTVSWMLGTTRGVYKPNMSFTIYKRELQDLLDKLGQGYMEKRWNCTVSYAEAGQPTLTDEIPAVRIMKITDNPKEGEEPISCKVDCHVGGIIKRNGKLPVSDAPGIQTP